MPAPDGLREDAHEAAEQSAQEARLQLHRVAPLAHAAPQPHPQRPRRSIPRLRAQHHQPLVADTAPSSSFQLPNNFIEEHQACAWSLQYSLPMLEQTSSFQNSSPLAAL